MRIIATIENEDIIEEDDGTVKFVSRAAIDSDGSGGNVWDDPYFQPATSLRLDGGVSLNANKVPYIVVPPAIIHGVVGIVLGCQGVVRNIKNGLETLAVVGDIGPHHKLGEISVECARRIGIDSSPIIGGVDEHVIEYEIKPGEAAVVDGILYPLQKARKSGLAGLD